VREDESDEGVGTRGRRCGEVRTWEGCAMKEQGGMCGPRSLGSRLLVQAASAVRGTWGSRPQSYSPEDMAERFDAFGKEGGKASVLA
jgi:hypothetical protein